MILKSNFMKIVLDRYSVRDFNPDKPVSDSHMASLLEAARLAPSACNAQPWRFIIVTDTRIRAQLWEKGLGGLVSNRFLLMKNLCLDP